MFRLSFILTLFRSELSASGCHQYVAGNKMPSDCISACMFAYWIGAFIAGILLGKSGFFPELQNLALTVSPSFILVPAAVASSYFYPIRMKLLRMSRTLTVALCALVWGLVHGAPEYIGPCVEAASVRSSAWQIGRAPAIVSQAGHIYETIRSPSGTSIGGYVVGSGFLWNRVRSSNCGSELQPEFHRYTEYMLERYLNAGGEPELIPWIGATVFGSRKGLNLTTERSFRESGLVHILVVSGMHVSLFALFVRIALLLPFLPAYAFTVLNPSKWRVLVFWSEFVSLPLVCFYVWLIGSPNPAQRAAAFYVAWVLGKLFFGLRRPVDRFTICLVVQTVLFPIGFLGAGNIMSWLATLFVVTNFHAREGDPWSDFLSLFDWRLQVRIMVIAAAMFAEIAPLSIPGNLLLAPVFGGLLQATYLIVLFPDSWLSTLLYFQTEAYLSLVKICGDLSEIPGLSILAWRPINEVIRILAIGVSAVLVLNSLKHLSIRACEAKPFMSEANTRIKPS